MQKTERGSTPLSRRDAACIPYKYVSMPGIASNRFEPILRETRPTLYNHQRIRLGKRTCFFAKAEFVTARRGAGAPKIDRGFQFVDRYFGHGLVIARGASFAAAHFAVWRMSTGLSLVPEYVTHCT
jgi:hypothetical protein